MDQAGQGSRVRRACTRGPSMRRGTSDFTSCTCQVAFQSLQPVTCQTVQGTTLQQCCTATVARLGDWATGSGMKASNSSEPKTLKRYQLQATLRMLQSSRLCSNGFADHPGRGSRTLSTPHVCKFDASLSLSPWPNSGT